MEAGKIYHLSERYIRKMYKDIILNELITFVFYFVFNILFSKHARYDLIRPLLGVIFMVLAVALIWLGKKRADKARAFSYKVKKEGLECFDGSGSKGRLTFYEWKSFKEIRKNSNRVSMIFPYELHTDKGIFTLHRQLDEPDALLKQIAEATGLEIDF